MEKHPLSYYTINGITIYRLLSAPLLLCLAIFGNLELFRWLLALSFLTDAVDGHLSRVFRVSSVLGAKLDSIADDATVLAATVSLWIVRPDFIEKHWLAFVIVFTLFIIQTIVALKVYKRVTSFHTYLAKTAAVLQGIFFMMIFFNIEPLWLGFYAAAVVTAIQLAEEIVLVFLLPDWKTDVKGLFWVMRKHEVNAMYCKSDEVPDSRRINVAHIKRLHYSAGIFRLKETDCRENDIRKSVTTERDKIPLT